MKLSLKYSEPVFGNNWFNTVVTGAYDWRYSSFTGTNVSQYTILLVQKNKTMYLLELPFWKTLKYYTVKYRNQARLISWHPLPPTSAAGLSGRGGAGGGPVRRPRDHRGSAGASTGAGLLLWSCGRYGCAIRDWTWSCYVKGSY